MGNSCSSGQAHKDKDNMSQRSEESGSYQVRSVLPSEKQQTLLNHIGHTGVLLEPATAGQPPDAAPADRRPNMSKVLKGIATANISDSVSLNSPTSAQSPKDFEQQLPPEGRIPEQVMALSENLQNLIMGRISQARAVARTRKIVIYVCAADSQDCCVEKGALHNTVYPELRAHCRAKGYELHIVDLHWKTILEKQQDHEFPELCIGELTRQAEVAYVIPVLFLNNSLGTPLLPITIESADFQMAMGSAENQAAQSLLSKWYQLDGDAQPPCYRLRPISHHIPGFKETSPEERERAFEEWRSEIDKMLGVLIAVFSQELRDTYLTTVVEQEVHNTVFMSQELAKRCLWINRVFTPTAKTPDNPNPEDAELCRRLNILQKDLRNQLAEKHIVRLVVKYLEGGLSLKHPEHVQYIQHVVAHLQKHLTEMVDGIVEEHQAKHHLRSSYGIEAPLFEELNQQTGFCQRAAQCSVNREKTINDIKTYISDGPAAPFVLTGVEGSGKTTLLARVAQCCQQWVPEAFVIFRFVGISAQSGTIEQTLNSITNQCSILAHGHKFYGTHSIDSYKENLPNLLAASCLHRPVLIILDGIDQVPPYSSKSLEWLPSELPANVKIIISISEGSRFHVELMKKLSEDSFTQMPPLGQAEAKGILMSSVMQYNHSINSKIQDCVLKSVQECTLPLYSKVLAWQTSWWADKEHNIVPKGDVNAQMILMLEELETILGMVQVQHALALITNTKHGITDSEVIDLLAFDDNFHSTATYVSWAPAYLTWSMLIKHLAPFLQWTLCGEMLCIQWRDNMLRKAVQNRYKDFANWAHQMLYDYYEGKWWTQKSIHFAARLACQETFLSNRWYNRRKLDELPFHYYALKGEIESSKFVTDLMWVYEKVCGSTCRQILEDINMQPSVKKCETLVLKEFLETHESTLTYDGRQFYSQLRTFMEDKHNRKEINLQSNDLKLVQMYNLTKNPPVFSFIPLNHLDGEEGEGEGRDPQLFRESSFDLVMRLPNCEQFFVSVSTNREEICVWDIKTCNRIRTLKGVPYPTNLIPIDQFRCIVLCRRELRIYDLNSGRFLAKLKGVMNQRMPFFGLHDQSHLVALSRNRMYVNLMNLETGDCVTTFKAGEDRFLNSLLVSGDGRILVCGDETQKPFPLLVWNLESRKLLYDLRIPHHDFITSLSAITHEGSYVCCVCHELDEPNPNFIVVYDLQSGTLFKKWKPSCNTVSLEISSPASCVISGLEDARILVWDLITGNCRWSLSGHSAPVSMLKLDPAGTTCLSMDLECRDRSIRVWNLNKGNLVSVYTPKSNITACTITTNGAHIVLALEGETNILVLELMGPNLLDRDLNETYGMSENDGKVFELKESDVC